MKFILFPIFGEHKILTKVRFRRISRFLQKSEQASKTYAFLIVAVYAKFRLNFESYHRIGTFDVNFVSMKHAVSHPNSFCFP